MTLTEYDKWYFNKQGKTMKKSLVIGTSAILMAMNLTGCGSSEPKEVAEEFSYAMSKADLETANELATKKMQEEISWVHSKCNEDNAEKYGSEAYRITEKMEKLSRDDKEMKEAMEAIEKASKDYFKEIEKTIVEKYGKEDDWDRDTKRKVQEEAKELVKKELVDKLRPYVEEAYDIGKFETPKDLDADIVKELVVGMQLGGMTGERVRETLKRVINEKFAEITPECVDKNTLFGNIDDINYIETTGEKADQKEVRLEIVTKKDESKKVTVKLEKLKGEWKIKGARKSSKES